MLSHLLLASAVLFAPAQAADCSPSAVQVHVDGARAAFFALDETGFRVELEAMRQVVACMDTPIAPTLAAEVHSVVALDGFLSEDEGRTLAAFHAVRRSAPDFDLKQHVEGYHPILLEWRLSGRVQPSAPEPFVRAEDNVLVDGLTATGRALDQPAVLQRTHNTTVTDSLLWLPPATVPTWAEARSPRVTPEVRRRLWWGGATFVTAAASGTLLAIASSAHERYVSEDVAYQDLDDAESRLRAVNISGVVTATAMVGCATGLVLTW